MMPTVPWVNPNSCGESPRPPLCTASIRNRVEILDNNASGIR